MPIFALFAVGMLPVYAAAEGAAILNHFTPPVVQPRYCLRKEKHAIVCFVFFMRRRWFAAMARKRATRSQEMAVTTQRGSYADAASVRGGVMLKRRSRSAYAAFINIQTRALMRETLPLMPNHAHADMCKK